MSITEILCAVVFTSLAVSYGWGMRGCVIGGEKGALLPGAILGLCVSLFVFGGTDVALFSAAGALSVFFGGIEPYGQTMRYVLHRHEEKYRGRMAFGLTGIFIKGGLWFGIGGAVIALLPQALSGDFEVWETVLIFALIPVLSFIGVKIFNSPYDREKGIFPRLYFSDSSREEWGGNLLVFLEFVTVALVKHNISAVIISVSGFVFGGTGFVAGLLLYGYTVTKHRGRYPFGRAQEKGLIDGWKIMEHTFGAIAGGGVMLVFCLLKPYLTGNTTMTLLREPTDNTFSIITLALLLLTALQYPLVSVIKRKTGNAPDIHYIELIERPMWAAFPLIFVFMGDSRSAFFSCFVAIAYALSEQCITDLYDRTEKRTLINIGFIAYFILSLTAFFCIPQPSPFLLMLSYTLPYVVAETAQLFQKEIRRDRKEKGLTVVSYHKSRLTVILHFAAQSIVLLALTGIMQ